MKIEKYIKQSNNIDELNEIFFSKSTFIWNLVYSGIKFFILYRTLNKKAEESIKGLEIKAKDEINSAKISKIVKEDVEVYYSTQNGYNAFSVKDKQICYTLKLGTLLTEDELHAVLLHEYGHSKEKHGAKKARMLYTTTLAHDIIASIISGFIPKFSILLQLFSTVLSSFKMTKDSKIYTHERELAADSYAAKFNYCRQLVSALKKLRQYQIAELKAEMNIDCIETLNKLLDDMEREGGYPTIKERIDNILKKMNINGDSSPAGFMSKFIKTKMKSKDDDSKE